MNRDPADPDWGHPLSPSKLGVELGSSNYFEAPAEGFASSAPESDLDGWVAKRLSGRDAEVRLNLVGLFRYALASWFLATPSPFLLALLWVRLRSWFPRRLLGHVDFISFDQGTSILMVVSPCLALLSGFVGGSLRGRHRWAIGVDAILGVSLTSFVTIELVRLGHDPGLVGGLVVVAVLGIYWASFYAVRPAKTGVAFTTPYREAVRLTPSLRPRHGLGERVHVGFLVLFTVIPWVFAVIVVHETLSSLNS